ncbi:MAG: DNA-binding protein [Clostridia bacterium]|nr:DNA-binding protein [Clostridia bacterium]
MEKTNDWQQKQVWGERDLEKAGFSRTMSYQLLARKDVPTITIGGRKFVHRELFMEWLKGQASRSV